MTSQLLTKRGFDALFQKWSSRNTFSLYLVGEKGTERAKVPLVPGEQQALERCLQEVPFHKDKTESGEFVEL